MSKSVGLEAIGIELKNITTFWYIWIAMMVHNITTATFIFLLNVY